MTKIIHVNRQNIAMNVKDGGSRPCVTLKEGSKPARYAKSIEILGPCKIGELSDQLPCGAKVWIETDADVVLENETTFQGSRQNELAR